MRLRALALLGGVSAIALSSAAVAQESRSPLGTFLGTITLILSGQENIEATGGAVVAAEDIEALQPADVSELFARESAVTVSGGAGPSKRIHIFGMEQSQLAVSVDGVPQSGTGWHHTGSNVIDPAFLKSVEVEAGAAAADAGFGAAAGAVRYETISAADMLAEGETSAGRVALSYGSNGRGASGSLGWAGRAGGLDWLVMGHVANGTNYKAGNGLTMDGTAPAVAGGVAKVGYEFDGHRVELAYEHSTDDDDRVIKMNMDLYGPGLDRGVYPLKVTRDTLSLKYTATSPTDAWDPEVMIYLSSNGYERPNYVLGDLAGGAANRPNGDMNLNADSLGGVVKNTFTLGTGTITAGLDFAHDDYSIDNYGDHTNGQPRFRTFSTTQAGVFVQGRLAFENGLDLSAGARHDFHRFDTSDGLRYSGSGTSVNATLSYAFTEGFEVFAGGSRTWLGYDVGEYGLLHARSASFASDPNYQPATARNFKLGLNASGEAWTAGVTLFDTAVEGLASYGASTMTNGGKLRSRGFTLNGGWTWDSGRAGLSYTNADVTVNGELSGADGGSFMPIGDVASLYVDQDIASMNLTVGATVEWAGTLSDDLATPRFRDHESYTVVNAYAEWHPAANEDLRVRLGIDNLFDATYYERSSYISRAIGARDVQPLLAPGRTVSLGVSMNF